MAARCSDGHASDSSREIEAFSVCGSQSAKAPRVFYIVYLCVILLAELTPTPPPACSLPEAIGLDGRRTGLRRDGSPSHQLVREIARLSLCACSSTSCCAKTTSPLQLLCLEVQLEPSLLGASWIWLVPLSLSPAKLRRTSRPVSKLL